MSIYQGLLQFFAVIWRALFWGVYFIVTRYFIDYYLGISYVQRAELFSLFMLFSIAAMIFFNRHLIHIVRPMLGGKKMVLPFVASLGAFALYWFLSATVDPSFVEQHFRYHYFAYFMPVYALTKSLDIIFQQLIFILALHDLWQAYGRRLAIWQFTSLMGVMHLPTCFIFGLPFGPFFLLAGLIAGGIFSIMLTNQKVGLCYSYFIHWLFYLALSLFMYLYTIPRLPQ